VRRRAVQSSFHVTGDLQMHRFVPRLALALWLSLSGLVAQAAAMEQFQRENVLGTSFELRVEAPPEVAQAALQATLAEVQRLDAVLSTWRDDSELTRFNAGTGLQDVSPDLRAVLSLCEQWRTRTHGLFSCRLGRIAERWRQAAASGVLPARGELRALAAGLARAEFDVPAQGPLIRPDALRFDVDGLAKGYILDRALAAARAAAPQARAIKLDIGGDAVYWQRPDHATPWRVGVADARHPRDNGTPLAVLALQRRAIAASGHATRGYQVGRRHYSHILDPLSGWPMQFAPSATVTADDAASADALATALSVVPIRDGLALAESVPGVAALVLSDTGVPFVSHAWPALLAEAADTTSSTQDAEALVLDYEIPQLQAQRYHAPYVAVWITRPDGAAIRQLLVLGERSRYLLELPQWWRRYGRDDLPAIQGIARPTRLPGKYSLSWDGRDDRGQRLPAGAYLLQVEAARQDGGHELLTLPFHLDGRRAVQVQRQGTAEIGTITLRSAARH
jgi:thiamine biosynthesis lipoprotein